MSRLYSKELLRAFKDKEVIQKRFGVSVRVKPIPDSDIDCAMDTRVYKSTRSTAFFMKLVPKGLFKFNNTPKSLARIRKIFDSVDSHSMDLDVSKESFEITSFDGTAIPMHRFESKHTLDDTPVLYFVHGGGFFAGSTNVISEAVSLLVENTGIIAYGIDYRLAPENPFPTGHKDVLAGLEWIFEKEGKKVFVTGDSAGGNLSVYCSNQHPEMVKGQLLLYPTLNMGGIKDDYVDYSVDDIPVYEKQKKLIMPGILIFQQAAGLMAELLAVDDMMNQDLTPYIDVSPLSPPTYISVGEHDFLSIESIAYARKLRDLDVYCDVAMYCGMGHAYIDKVGVHPQAEDCINEMGEFILRYSNND